MDALLKVRKKLAEFVARIAYLVGPLPIRAYSSPEQGKAFSWKTLQLGQREERSTDLWYQRRLRALPPPSVLPDG